MLLFLLFLSLLGLLLLFLILSYFIFQPPLNLVTDNKLNQVKETDMLKTGNSQKNHNEEKRKEKCYQSMWCRE